MTAPDPGALDTALAAERTAWKAFADAQYGAGASLQASKDAVVFQQDQTTIDGLNATITDLRAQLAALQPAEVIEFKDFSDQNAGMRLANKSLLGKGIDKTIYRMTPKSSTKGPSVPNVKPNTNPYRLMRIGGGNASQKYPNLEIGGFTLEGTDQGHLYGGLNLDYSVGLNVHDLLISGIPGNDSGPPGETFTLATWHTQDATISRVTLDGRRKSDGAKVAATLCGYNFNEGTTTADELVANYAIYGFAVAMWQCVGHQIFNNCDFRYCRKAINIEQAFGGTYDFNACDFRGVTSVPYVAQISARQSSAVVNFHDPVVDSYPMQVNTFPSASANVQKDSDIHMFIGGKDVTSDPSKFKITHL